MGSSNRDSDLRLVTEIRGERIEVVISLASGDPVRLWEPQNSWGWGAISIELRADGGDSSHFVERRERDWTKNGPTYFVLAPGEMRDFPVRLDDGWWHLGYDFSSVIGRPFQVRAWWRTPPTPEAAELGVWVGTLVSDWAASTPPHHWL